MDIQKIACLIAVGIAFTILLVLQTCEDEKADLQRQLNAKLSDTFLAGYQSGSSDCLDELEKKYEVMRKEEAQ